MGRPQPRFTRTDTLVPYTTLVRADLPQRDHHADRGEARADHRRRPAELRDAIEAPRHRIDEACDLPQHEHPRDAVHAGSRAHRLPRSEEHTSELQSLMRISYAVFCLKKKHMILEYLQLT